MDRCVQNHARDLTIRFSALECLALDLMTDHSAQRFVAILSLSVPFVGLALLAFPAGCSSNEAADDGVVQRDSTAEGGAPLEPAGTRICSWNMRRLGHKFDGTDKDIPGATAIITENCDVLAVEEVMQTAGNVTPGYDALLASLGTDWGGLFTTRPRPDTTSPNAERYAFFYRKSAASLCSGWTAGAEYIKDPNDAFLREPAWTCFKLVDRDRELVLAAYHALYGSLAERRREVALISDDVDGDGVPNDVVREMRASRPNADVVLVGDFNLTTNELREVLPSYKDLTAGNGSTLNDHDDVTTNEYDHVVMAPDEPLLTDFTPAEVLDVRPMAHTGPYFKTISDHLPIRFHLGKTPH
jgi:endonuclease/exonuclease/phosphatase family metal-dependent hydrolase